MSHLTLRYEPEDEHHGELFMAGGIGGFTGQSSAWFNKTDIEAFSASLAEYPIAAPRLAGGSFRREGALEEVWTAIEVRPWNATGTLVALVEMNWSRRPVDDWRERRVAFDFLTDYAALDTFRRQIVGMLADAQSDATLIGFDD